MNDIVVGSELAHYGILRKSGRYPWGSGNNSATEAQRAHNFITMVAELRSSGMDDKDIAASFNMTTTQLRETNTIALNARKASEITQAVKMKQHGMSNTAIAASMGRNESYVRTLLADSQKDRVDILTNTTNVLREHTADGSFLDIGLGQENHLGISKEKLNAAIAILKDEEPPYVVQKIQVSQAGAPNNKTTIKILCPPGTTYVDAKNNVSKIKSIEKVSDNGGRTFYGLFPPKNFDSSRLAINYAEDGGANSDGVLYVRPGVKDISLGGSRYAQVRVLVDGTHYLKGMAVYKDDLPPGVDIVFNTNKSKEKAPNKLDVLKPITEDPDNPFGATIRQLNIYDKDGNPVKPYSVMNIVNKEGDWQDWRNTISSQVLSKQSPVLAKDRLKAASDKSRADLDEILALTNPAVKKRLLQAYADSADAAAVNLKAAALPRQASHVILPVQSLKENEVYAPNYKNGERVVLIRYPHGGTFEIPELTVNNRNAEAKSMMGPGSQGQSMAAKDAVGIHPKVAQRLSGADFDGDFVLVIPNDRGQIKTSPALTQLKDFDPIKEYPKYPGMEVMREEAKGYYMGKISNLITDMTIQRASSEEIARAVKHSMVVIDAVKHELNYKESYKNNGISALVKKYQGKDDGSRPGGAATLISRAKSPVNVKERRPRSMKDGGPIDKATGRQVYEETGATYVDRKTGKTVYKTQQISKMRATDDAHTLVSKDGGTPIEHVYADYANRMKALANEARKENLMTYVPSRNESAKNVYNQEVQSLLAKLDLAQRNRPRERQAQIIAKTVVAAKVKENPHMDKDQIRRANRQALAQARERTQARKNLVEITDKEWEAIQAGALTKNQVKQILDNTDIDKVRERAMPRDRRVMTKSNVSRARAMLAAGHTQSEVAQALGVSLSTLKESLND